MKKQYEIPEMEVIEFETADVISGSGDNETEVDGF
jgi:hypothetical protein